MKTLMVLWLAVFAFESFAYTADWRGSLGIKSTSIKDYRYLEDGAFGTGPGSQDPGQSGAEADASFSTMTFRLSPTFVINDSASLVAEFSSGYGRTRHLGQNQVTHQGNNIFGGLYSLNTSDGNESLALNQLYMELFSDTATYKIGRHCVNWGLGAIMSCSESPWATHFSLREGLTANIKLGSFSLTPFYGRIVPANSLLNDEGRTREYGVELLYDNYENDMTLGVYYARRSSGKNGYAATTGNTSSKVEIADFFLKKGFGDFTMSLEVPYISGEVASTDLQAVSYIADFNYQINDDFSFGLGAGYVGGEDASGKLEASYLNPNFKVAKLLFNYNRFAINDRTKSLFDSYVTNTQYLRLYADYALERWNFNAALIYATALETAENGKAAYNHQTGASFTAAANQEDDLGLEVDLGFEYKWNDNVSVVGDFAYLTAGDYFAFSNNPSVKLEAASSYLMSFGVSLSF